MQRGFATLEIIFAVMIIALLMSAALPNVTRIVDTAALDYETKRLYSDLRLLQTLSRCGTISNVGTGKNFTGLDPSPSMQITPAKLTWQLQRGNKALRDPHYMQHVKNISAPSNKISFDTAGNAEVNGTLTLTSRLGKQSTIVFDSVGRFRGGRVDE